MFEQRPFLVQLYLFLCGAFFIFVSTFLPWVCYDAPGEQVCADGYSRALFASGDVGLLESGGLIVLPLLLFTLFAALNRDGLDTRGTPTTFGALILLFLATLFYLNAVWQGSYQTLQDDPAPRLHIGLILALLGEMLMVGVTVRTWLAVRPLRPTLALDGVESDYE